MKIKADKRKLLLHIPFFTAVIIFVSFFVWQIKINGALKKDLSSKMKEFEEAEAASRRLRGLEKQISDLKKKEEVLYKKIPSNEKEPLDLMKTIIRLGGESGLREITVNLKEEISSASGSEESQGQAVASSGSDEEGGQPPPPEQAEEEAAQPVLQQEKTFPIYLEMTFEANFSQLLSFLNKLEHLERIVKVEGLVIERKKEILPYQKVSLDLVTYTFLK